MKKHYFVLIFLIILSVFVVSCSKKETASVRSDSAVAASNEVKSSSEPAVLNVYAYDSFCGDWGAGNAIVKAFQEKTGIKVNLIGSGAALQMYSRYALDTEHSDADVLVGLADNMQIDESLFYEWEPECKADLVKYDSKCLIPFNYGFYSFLVNKDFDLKNISLPKCLNDLTKDEFAKTFILIDPRTSSVGMGLLKWTILSLGEENAYEWWNKACKNALTVGDSWSSAYGIFTQGEAPFVLSYTTSPVYHRMYENNYNIVPLDFSDGFVKTTEYLAIPKSSKNKDAAREFCEFVLTHGQKDIAVMNTMFPANEKTELPKEFSEILKPSHVLEDDSFVLHQDEYIDKWTKTVVR